jgi:hypothetical protein
MNPNRTSVGVLPSTEMCPAILNGARKLDLINEALSRTRMRWRQEDATPATGRPARVVALQARRRAARDLGDR